MFVYVVSACMCCDQITAVLQNGNTISICYRCSNLQGTRVEKVINELFEGHTLNFIECMNVEYKSSRRESFMDLQLDVKGCKDIYESFDR